MLFRGRSRNCYCMRKKPVSDPMTNDENPGSNQVLCQFAQNSSRSGIPSSDHEFVLPTCQTFSVIYATLKQTTPLHTHKNKTATVKTGLKQQFMIFTMLAGKLGWPCLSHLYGCGQPKPQVDGRDDSPSCYLGPHLGCLEWLGSSASLSMKSITEGLLHVERSIIRGKAKNKVSGGQDQKFLSFFGHILIKQNTRPEQTQGKRFHLFRGSEEQKEWEEWLQPSLQTICHMCLILENPLW